MTPGTAFVWLQFEALPPVTTGMVVVFGIALVAFALFASEVVRVDVTALGIMFSLMVLGRWTRISPAEGVSGFSNEATIIVLMMFILSAGIRRTGLVQRLSAWMLSVAGADELRQLLVTVGVAGIPSGFINNTPVVAMLIPAVTEMARKTGTSPSKLLIPLSYASIFGGTLTLIGTTSNLLASDLSRRLLGQRISMFEFTPLGIVVFLTGMLYLLLIGRHFIPERVDPGGVLLGEYGMDDYSTAVVVEADSALVGQPLEAIRKRLALDVDVLSVIRDDERFTEPSVLGGIRAGDLLVVRADLETLRALTAAKGLSVASSRRPSPDELDVTGESLGDARNRRNLIELVVPSASSYADTALADTPFHDRYDASVLAIRRGGDVIHHRLDETILRGGDTLLVQVAETAADRLTNDHDFIVVREIAEPDYRTEKIPHVIGIVGGVVGLAALGVLNLLVAALGGVIAMVLADVLEPEELYEAVDWDVIFLLAGVIPLGIAFEDTGAADFLGALVALSAEFLPPIAVLWVFYAMTVLLTALISNAASVVLMVPIAVETAGRIGADPFVFVLAVMFASSADLMTPIGYQTNLLVYGPGGYKFTDYFRVGAPLEVVLSIVTVLGLNAFWGV